MSAPQTVLDELIGRLGANPGEFLALTEKQQRAAVLKLVELPFDLDALEAERRSLYDDRTVIGRDVAAAKALVAAETDPGPGETEPISVADAAKAWADAVAANTTAAAHQRSSALRPTISPSSPKRANPITGKLMPGPERRFRPCGAVMRPVDVAGAGSGRSMTRMRVMTTANWSSAVRRYSWLPSKL